MNDNPAWHEYLADIPEDLHEKVTPAFEKWDANIQGQFEKYAPWKDVMGSANPDSVQFALNFVNALESDPELVHRTIGEFYKLGGDGKPTGGAPVEQEQQQIGESNDAYERRLQELENQNRILGEYLVTQRNTAQQEAEIAQAEKALDAELAALKTKHGEFDELYVLGLLQAGLKPEEAVSRYKAMETRLTGSTMPRPLFQGAGGTGLPGTQIDPKKATDAQVRGTVEQMLAQAAASRRSG